MSDSWNLTPMEWRLMSKCNKCAYQLFPYGGQVAEDWARWAYYKSQERQVSPEILRDERSPQLLRMLRKRPPKNFS